MRTFIYAFLALIISCPMWQCTNEQSKEQQPNRNAPAATKEQSQKTIQNVSPQEAITLFLEEDELIVFDVRTSREYKHGHIPGAESVNVLNKNFREKISKYDRNQPYLLYCRSGARSQKAARIMKELGFENIYNMKGGFEKWKEKGLNQVR